jgi:hypothetical protein
MSRILIASVLFLFASVSLPAQIAHPDLTSGKVKIKNVAILPPAIRIVRNGVKANEEMVEESRNAENALVPLIANALQKRGCIVDEKQFSNERLQNDEKLKYALADAQRKFDEVYAQINKSKNDIKKGRFTLGEDISTLNPGGIVDALIFVRGSGTMITTGKAVVNNLEGHRQAGNLYYDITVVDAHSGAILYFSHINNGGAMVRLITITDRSQKWIDEGLKNFPAQNAN